MTDLALIEWIEFLKIIHNEAKMKRINHAKFYSYCSKFIQEISIESIKIKQL